MCHGRCSWLTPAESEVEAFPRIRSTRLTTGNSKMGKFFTAVSNSTDHSNFSLTRIPSRVSHLLNNVTSAIRCTNHTIHPLSLDYLPKSISADSFIHHFSSTSLHPSSPGSPQLHRSHTFT